MLNLEIKARYILKLNNYDIADICMLKVFAVHSIVVTLVRWFLVMSLFAYPLLFLILCSIKS